MKLAIVEDEETEKDRLVGFLKKVEQEKEISFDIDYFEDASKFLYSYKGGYDVVLMDIEMPGINGLDAARELRKKDDDIFIVFVTNMKQFASKGYEVSAIDFIIKPTTYYGIESCMEKILRIKSQRIDKKINIKTNDGIRIISLSSIVYIEVLHHKVYVHTQDETIETWASLSKMEEDFPKNLFSKCNVSYLVNLNYVKGIQGDECVLPTGRIKISRNRKKQFISDLTSFIGATV